MNAASPAKPTLVALLHGPDQPGLVAKTANWIYERDGNILHADQHRDDEAGIFFQRIEWEAAGATEGEKEDFSSFVKALGMKVSIAQSNVLPRVALFVSKIEHCFVDFLARWKMGDFPAELVCVISNHTELRSITEYYGLPFHHIPVGKETKKEAENSQVSLLRDYKVDLVVMARYMQVLSADFLATCGCPVINIHHSFLPAFAGAKPYHQAHSRGVKLIGATAHYATAVLDDGPIIQQDVSPVNHRHSVRDLVRRGRDLEKSVLAQAVRWHLEHRVLVYGNKTVVFD
ncbi:formyltetrahydrofolate deformylase [Puniceicoccales bacterium CK1056]|uniref:Formyltetrahydrofolate deformylase n=1 Tax=Oceanipulchritudo coccoides TaxID=2706888 RepID=A0A6B2M2L0_9BACT|nr:formyltetrahydrofolate deformylase [Oceanipulchritudo coccoides]NDV62364.1 formyltetrahydrofolate deformylase [Oceanipulchritudo coccoides]